VITDGQDKKFTGHQEKIGERGGRGDKIHSGHKKCIKR
jgi:hypothetical protein